MTLGWPFAGAYPSGVALDSALSLVILFEPLGSVRQHRDCDPHFAAEEKEARRSRAI